MNPILLKPQAATAQVFVRGQVSGVQTASDYFDGTRSDLWPVVADALDRLRSSFDMVIAEGAGSPAEINLRARDIVNMRVALHAGAEGPAGRRHRPRRSVRRATRHLAMAG